MARYGFPLNLSGELPFFFSINLVYSSSKYSVLLDLPLDLPLSSLSLFEVFLKMLTANNGGLAIFNTTLGSTASTTPFTCASVTGSPLGGPDERADNPP